MFLRRLRDQGHVRFRSASDIDGDEAASLNDLVERAAVDDQILDDGKGPCAPRLDPDLIAVFEFAHVQLTCGQLMAARSMRDTVDHHSARAADALATVVIEMNAFLAF